MAERIRLIKGVSAPARYYPLRSLIEQRREEMAIEYRCTYDDYVSQTNGGQPLRMIDDDVRMGCRAPGQVDNSLPQTMTSPTFSYSRSREKT